MEKRLPLLLAWQNKYKKWWKHMDELVNKIFLITYPNSMGKNLPDLQVVLDQYFRYSIGGIHILPFFPSSGDRGFAPLDYQSVDECFGTWEDIRSLSGTYTLMSDLMINHISAKSVYYQDFLAKKDESAYSTMFIRYKDFWEKGEPSSAEAELIYKRKPKEPYTIATFAEGSEEKVWCTFSDEQIDLNCKSDATRDFIKSRLIFMAQSGISYIRLDAFAYTIKKAGTSCFFIEPDIWELLQFCSDILMPLNAQILPEIHEHYTIQLKIADKGYYVYDFALPFLVLNAIYYGKAEYLKNWFSICPRKQFTTLDTHDGIGVVDVRGLLPDSEIDRTYEAVFEKGANVKKVYSSASYDNLDIYQINCTYYSALGNDDNSYLLARAIQFFAPGTPQVYYVGLLAGRNDIDLLEKTKEGRNINRHNYSLEEVSQEVQRPVVKRLIQLMEFRNASPAFDGTFELFDCAESEIRIRRVHNSYYAELYADLALRRFTITYKTLDGIEELFLA